MILSILPILSFLAFATADDPLTDVDRKALVKLTGARETPRAVFHFEPEAYAAKALDEDVAANVAALAELEKTLDLKYRGRVHVFLHRDVDAMKQLTGVGNGTVAFSTGTVSVHQPHDFRGVHEFVHIYALQFARGPDTAGPDGFAVEGLATYLAQSDEGVPIHAWAAAYARAGVLPGSIVEFRRTWPNGCGNGVHAYHVAGSFCGFLVERFGMAKTKSWYVDSTEAHQYFGKGAARIEREWREWLAKLPIESAHEKHVLRKLGLDHEPMPQTWSTAKGTPLFDGKSLAGLEPQDASKWSVKDGALVGTNDGAWTAIATTKPQPARVGVRAKLRFVRGDAVKVAVNGNREAIFAAWSSFATAGAGFTGNDRVKIPHGQWVEIVVVNDGGRARVYLDGKVVFDHPGLWGDASTGSLALGVEKGVVEVKEWVAFEP